MNDTNINEIISNHTKTEIKKEKTPISKSKKFFNQKGIYHTNFKNKTIKDKKDNNYIKYKNIFKKGDKTTPKKSNNLMKYLIILSIIALVIYFIVTRYLCVGFIKVNNNQILEFNNQSNKIEIV